MRKELIILAADKNTRFTLEGLLTRHRAFWNETIDKN